MPILLIRSHFNLLAISCDRLVGLSRLLQLQPKFAGRTFMIRIHFDLLAERANRIRVIVRGSIGQPQRVPPIFHARIRQTCIPIRRALQQVNRPAVVLGVKRLHACFFQLRGRPFHLRACLIAFIYGWRENRAREQLIVVAARHVPE